MEDTYKVYKRIRKAGFFQYERVLIAEVSTQEQAEQIRRSAVKKNQRAFYVKVIG